MNQLKISGCLVVFLIVFIGNCYSANILCLFYAPSYSRQQPMLTLSRALAERGHKLTVITTNPSKVPIENHREIDVSFLYKAYSDMQSKNVFTFQKKISTYKLVGSLPKIYEFVASSILSSEPVKKFIREIKENGLKYDLILYESIFHSSLLGFADILGNPPIIGILTMQIPSIVDSEFGNPVIPSYIPSVGLPFDDKMSFWERLQNVIIMVYFYQVLDIYNRPIQEKIMEEHFGKRKYTANEMEYNKSLLLVMCDLTTGYPKPVNPNTIYTGPVHVNTPEELPEDIRKWMDDAKDGVVYFSFGSNMKGTSVPKEVRSIFIEVFLQFPKIRFLWKWEADSKLPGQPINVLTKRWVPQQSVLAHPNLKVFITQVGLQSLQEAISFQIPILGVPMFSDQDFNAKKVVQSGAGLQLEFDDITFENLYGKIKELLTNTSYKDNMVRLSAIMNDKPMKSIDTAIWWVEYVIRHKGAPHLRPSSLDLPWYQYLMLDIALFLFIGLLFIILLIYLLVRRIIHFSKPKVKTC